MCLVEVNDLTHTIDLHATTIYKDNYVCIVQLKEEYIKEDRTKTNFSKKRFTHNLVGLRHLFFLLVTFTLYTLQNIMISLEKMVLIHWSSTMTKDSGSGFMATGTGHTRRSCIQSLCFHSLTMIKFKNLKNEVLKYSPSPFS